ncbi:MAG TPA: hypothetical protein DFS52_09640 [Myxococcales bacterium]|nr:hypothetical protein [Myxococcales bacterium]
MRYTEDETYVDMTNVAVHEFGHVLGLDHTTWDTDAVMRPWYHNELRALSRWPRMDDRRGLISIYGPNLKWPVRVGYMSASLNAIDYRTDPTILTTSRPAITYGGGRYAIAFVEPGPDGAVKLIESATGGESWSTPILVDINVTTSPAIIALADGSIVVFYSKQISDQLNPGYPRDTVLFKEFCKNGQANDSGGVFDPYFVWGHGPAAALYHHIDDGIAVASVASQFDGPTNQRV